jgi:hypothetical protein
MTEAEWLTWNTPESLLHGPLPNVTCRKLRLYAVACGRSVLAEFRTERAEAERALQLAEQYADGLVTLEELKREYDPKRALREPGWVVVAQAGSDYRHQQRHPDVNAAVSAARSAISFAPTAWVKRNPGQRQKSKGATNAAVIARATLLDLLRCIVGNPFRPVAFAPNWRTETAVALAAGIYAERAFDRLPILADALEEAGCDHAEVLNHCRGPGPHARGCWVVDGVLGKS